MLCAAFFLSGCHVTNLQRTKQQQVKKVKVRAKLFHACYVTNISKKSLQHDKEFEAIQHNFYHPYDSTNHYIETLQLDTSAWMYKDFRAMVIVYYPLGKRMKIYITGTGAIVIGRKNYKQNLEFVTYFYSLLPEKYRVKTVFSQPKRR